MSKKLCRLPQIIRGRVIRFQSGPLAPVILAAHCLTFQFKVQALNLLDGLPFKFQLQSPKGLFNFSPAVCVWMSYFISWKLAVSWSVKRNTTVGLKVVRRFITEHIQELRIVLLPLLLLLLLAKGAGGTRKSLGLFWEHWSGDREFDMWNNNVEKKDWKGLRVKCAKFYLAPNMKRSVIKSKVIIHFSKKDKQNCQ